MAENPRIEQLRRRVQQDPASIAFAQLAEEHRRAGEYEEAVRVCRAGLDLHPGYLSARVTLGRALLELGRFDEAQAELEHVLRAAPDNLGASRALAEIHRQRHAAPSIVPPDEASPARDFTLTFRSSDEQFAQALEALGALPLDLHLRPLSEQTTGPTLESTRPSRPSRADGTDAMAEQALFGEPRRSLDGGGQVRLDRPQHALDAALPVLEAWLEAILAARASRS